MTITSAATSRRAFLGLSLGTVAALTAACSGSDDASTSSSPAGKVDLRMMAFGSTVRQKKLQQVFDLYTKKYGGSVDLEIVSNDAFVQKLATEIAGGSAADVLALFHSLVPQYSAKGALQPLDRYVPDVLDVSSFDKSSIASGVIDGKRVALPLGDNAYGVIYDREAIEATGMKMPPPGHSWDEFVSFANDLSRKKGEGYYGTVDDSADMNGFEVFLRQRGKALYTKDAKLAFAQEDVEAWFEIWADLRASHAAPPGDLTVQTSTGGYGNSLMVMGKAANFFIYPNVLNSFQALTKSKLAVSTMPMPSSDKSGLYIRASNWASVYAKSDHPADSVRMINFILNDPDAAKVMLAEYGAPPNLKLREQLTFDSVDKIFIDYVDLVAKEFAQPIPSLAVEFPNGSPQIGTAFQTTAQTVATGKESISSGADNFISQAQGFLQ